MDIKVYALIKRMISSITKGEKGDKPVRGIDYWTDEDIAEIKSYVDAAITGGAW